MLVYEKSEEKSLEKKKLGTFPILFEGVLRLYSFLAGLTTLILLTDFSTTKLSGWNLTLEDL